MVRNVFAKHAGEIPCRSDPCTLRQGMHGNILVIFEQSTMIDRKLWDAAEALMKSPGCKWLALSSPCE